MNVNRITSRLIVSLSLGASALIVVPSHATATISSVPTNPFALSLPQPKAAWVLDRIPCGAKICVRLLTSNNQGSTWATQHLPSALSSWLSNEATTVGSTGDVHMHFSSAQDGWMYGAQRSTSSSASELWVTTTGGVRWSQIASTVRGLRTAILAVGSQGGNVYVVAWRDGQHFGLWRSPLKSNRWQLVATPTLPVAAGGSAMVGSLTFVGSTGWLIIGNDRGVTGAARLASSGDWVAMNAPCATVGNSFAVPVPLFGSTAVALCTIGGFGSNVDAGTPPSLALGTNWLFSSTDGGGSFHPLRVFGRSQQNQVVGASAAYGPYAASLFSTRSVNHATGVILQRSTSLGARWLTVASASSTALTPQFTSLRVAQNFGGVIVQTSPTHTTLWLTHDTGQHWSSTLR
jgi:hypothetical protein